jgi:EAL domain-containing protein (putative c-di-GMP-specific phosphodiesterase class I)
MIVVNKDSEAKLFDMVQTMRREQGPIFVIHLNFSRLQDRYRSDFQIKIAINIISDLCREIDGVIFSCRDNDLVTMLYCDNQAIVEKIIFQLRYLFIDDPLAYSDNESENKDFCDVYLLPIQWQDLALMAQRKVGSSAKFEYPKDADEVRLKPLTPHRLARLEPDIRTIDLSQIVRLQPICAWVNQAQFRVVFQECYIHIAHLRQALKTNVDLASNILLFRYLTEILDDRILNYIRQHPALYLKNSLSININIATLFSNEFAIFDTAIDTGAKSAVIFEIHIADIFADIEAFKTAADFLHRQGYRICIDGLSPSSFMQVSRELLHADLMKLQWNADHDVHLDNVENRLLLEAVRRCGQNRIILCRCDSPYSLNYGRTLGLSLFQGRYVDQVLNPKSPIVN